MTRQCALCGSSFEARRSDARFCSAHCRQRNYQIGAKQPPTSAPPGAKPVPPVSEADRALVATVQAQLRVAGQLATVDGQAALQVAEHLCRGTISGAERASLLRALNDSLARALAASDSADDAITVLRRRVAAKRAGVPHE